MEVRVITFGLSLSLSLFPLCFKSRAQARKQEGTLPKSSCHSEGLSSAGTPKSLSLIFLKERERERERGKGFEESYRESVCEKKRESVCEKRERERERFIASSPFLFAFSLRQSYRLRRLTSQTALERSFFSSAALKFSRQKGERLLRVAKECQESPQKKSEKKRQKP